MKNLIYLIVLVIISTPTYADDWREKCEILSKVGEVIMLNRQSGFSMAKMISFSKSKTLEGIVIVAYEEPRYSTEKQIARSVTEFSNNLYLVCVQKYKSE